MRMKSGQEVRKRSSQIQADGTGGAANGDAVRETNTASPPCIAESRGVRLCAECCVLQEVTGSAADFFGLLIINIQVFLRRMIK